MFVGPQCHGVNTISVGGAIAVPKVLEVRSIGMIKVKVKFTLEQATKGQRGSRSICLLFL
jgi:hypothetical protein